MSLGHKLHKNQLVIPVKAKNSSRIIVFTVTNNLVYDQRMDRICTSLSNAGYKVWLVGRDFPKVDKIDPKPYSRHLLSCFFNKGKLFYLEFNLRLFFYLLFKKFDAVCSIDLDTIIPGYVVSVIRKKIRIYDAHELFSELKEVRTRKTIHKIWLWVERAFVPKFKYGYTVSGGVAKELKNRYGVVYPVIRNMPRAGLNPLPSEKKEKFLVYTGAVNEGRGFEYLIPAMKEVSLPLVIAGDGNYIDKLKELIKQNNLEDKIILKGMLPPDELKALCARAFIGINLVENIGLNQYYSLGNKFFDYVQAGVPQVVVDFPEYKNLNQVHEVAVLIVDLQPMTIRQAIQQLIDQPELYRTLAENCTIAAKEWVWEKEEQKLLAFYKSLFKPIE